MDDQQQTWEPCPAGELTKLVETRRAAERRKVIDRFAVAAACCLAVLAVGGYTLGLFTPDNATPLHVLTCADVVPQLPAYVQGDLDETTRTNIASHLNRCSSCHTKYERLAQSVTFAIRAPLRLVFC